MNKAAEKSPCKCGCGLPVSPGHIWRRGHHTRQLRHADHQPRERACGRCGTAFVARWYGKGYEGYCKPCKAAYARERHKLKPPTSAQRERIRENGRETYRRRKAKGLTSRYGPVGITDHEALLLKEIQEGRCAICGDEATCLDHCHETGLVRAWLCRRCNVGLGGFRDSPDDLRRAAEYIEAFRC